MRNRINICVFDDFFADCMTNAIISMTLFYDESYRLAAYMNGYEPHFGPYPDQYFPYIGYSEGYKHIFERCFEYQGLLYEDDDYLKLVKKSINENTCSWELICFIGMIRGQHIKRSIWHIPV